MLLPVLRRAARYMRMRGRLDLFRLGHSQINTTYFVIPNKRSAVGNLYLINNDEILRVAQDEKE